MGRSMRSFDPRLVGGVECRAWETYFNDPAAARRLMASFYRLLTEHEPTTIRSGSGR